MEFKESQTKHNLMRAFAGESQARNRYTFAHGKALQQNLYVVAEVFKFTADQERAHAQVFYNHLKALTGQNIEIDGTYPIDLYDDVLGMLKAAKHNEFEEFEDVYPAFAKTAREEGFPKIAADFEAIAKIEKVHGMRFDRLAMLIENHELFASKKQEKWMCLNCGHIMEGEQVPEKCPVCDHDKGYFIRLELAPFSNQKQQ